MEIRTRVETYMTAILSNPEWLKNVTLRYGSSSSVGMIEIANAVTSLEHALRTKLEDWNVTKDLDL